MNSFSKIFVLLKKDLFLEARTRINFVTVVLFSLLVLLIFNFSFDYIGSKVDLYAPGILWITFCFAGVLALGRIMDHEKERWALKGLLLSPLDNSLIYLSKFLLHLTIMVLAQGITLLFFIVLFNPSWTSMVVLKILCVFVVTSIGFSSIGVLVSSMLFNERLKDLLMPLLFFPLVSQVVSQEDITYLNYMAGFSIIFLTVSTMLYEYVVEAD